MATRNARSALNLVQHNGQQGNAQLLVADYTVIAADTSATGLAVADVLNLLQIPAGSQVFGVDFTWTAAGGTATASFGYNVVDATTIASPARTGAFGTDAPATIQTLGLQAPGAAAQSVAAAGGLTAAVLPVGPFVQDVYLALTVGGSALPLGWRVTAALRGIFRGTL